MIRENGTETWLKEHTKSCGNDMKRHLGRILQTLEPEEQRYQSMVCRKTAQN